MKSIGEVLGAAAAARARAARTADAAAPSPRAVTRGESLSADKAACGIDWLNATFPAPSMSVEGIIALLAAMLGRPLSGLQGQGFLGFKHSVSLWAGVGARSERFGTLAWGGEAQQGRWMLQVTGGGCRLVKDWPQLSGWLQDLGAKITRLDIAVDLVDGAFSVDDAVGWYQEGRFVTSGRPPGSMVAGDWIGGEKGRTLYVGNSKNGKLLRVYEKGKQLGDSASEWVRFEVQFGSRDRVIPWDAMEDPLRFFAGAYPALQEVADLVQVVDPERIPTSREEGQVSLTHLVKHMRLAYGKVLDLLGGASDFDSSAFVEQVRVIGLPRRLHLSSWEAGVSAVRVLAAIKD